MNKIFFRCGWLYFGVFTYRIVPLSDGNFFMQTVHYFKLGITPKEKQVLEVYDDGI